jgi:hypothetical protein
MSDYSILSQDEQDDIVVDFMHAQERDKFCHELNLDRYDTILKAAEDGPWKKRVEDLRKETISRLAEVNSIIGATRKQLPPDARINAAKSRLNKAA